MQYALAYQLGQRAGGFNPLSLSPALWLSDTGSNVAQWDDLSGNGRHATQDTGISQPAIVTNALNGRQVRRFDGSNDTLALASDLSLGTQHTVFVVAQNSATITASTTQQLMLSGGSYTTPSTTTSDWLFGAGSLTGRLTDERLSSVVLANNGSGSQDIYGYGKTNSDVSGAFIAAQSFNTSGNLFAGNLNGATDYATASSVGGFTATNTRYPTILRAIGNRFSTGFSFWNGDIAEILVFPTALSTADRQRVELYLSQKYNIALA